MDGHDQHARLMLLKCLYFISDLGIHYCTEPGNKINVLGVFQCSVE